MIKAEFGIIEDIRETQEYSYDPKKYQCVCIDDDVYIDKWWNKLVLLKTYFHSLDRPELFPISSSPTRQGRHLWRSGRLRNRGAGGERKKNGGYLRMSVSGIGSSAAKEYSALYSNQTDASRHRAGERCAAALI